MNSCFYLRSFKPKGLAIVTLLLLLLKINKEIITKLFCLSLSVNFLSPVVTGFFCLLCSPKMIARRQGKLQKRLGLKTLQIYFLQKSFFLYL